MRKQRGVLKNNSLFLSHLCTTQYLYQSWARDRVVLMCCSAAHQDRQFQDGSTGHDRRVRPVFFQFFYFNCAWRIQLSYIGLWKRITATLYSQCLQLFSANESLRNSIFLSKDVSVYARSNGGKFEFILLNRLETKVNLYDETWGQKRNNKFRVLCFFFSFLQMHVTLKKTT